MENCCTVHKKKTKSTLLRAILFITVGILLFIPLIETYLSTGFMIYIFFTIVSLAVMYSIKEDFSVSMDYLLGLIVSISLALIAPYFESSILSISLLVAAIVFGFANLSLKLSSKKKTSLYNLFEFPSSEKVIILFVVLNWQISLFSLFPIASFAYPFVLHDTLFVMGLFILTNWIKQSMQTSDLPHNHMSRYVTVIVGEDEYEEKISNIKKNMRLKIHEETILPFKCKTLTRCEVGSTKSETLESIEQNTIINDNTLFFSGSVECQSDFEQVSHAYQSKNTESEDMFLSVFMVALLLIAICSGIYFGYISSSVVIGLQSFCLNLIVACPCVFLIAKPLISAKFLDWLSNHSLFKFNKMSNTGKPNILVFDRTHTLYERDPNNKNGPFILNSGIINMLTTLKHDGIKCYILSGHGTGNWESNLINCQKDLTKAVDPKNIIFNSKFHDPKEGRKGDIIKNLQLYGTLHKPKTLLENLYFRINNLFKPNIVGMIGDGDNDITAMKQADVSVCVGKDKSSYNSDVLKTANFCVEQKNLHTLPDMLSALGSSNNTYKIYIQIAFISNITLLALVNGLANYLFGINITASIACPASFVLCTLLLLSASYYKVTVPNRIRPEAYNCCSANSICCDQNNGTCDNGCCGPKVNINNSNFNLGF